MSEFCICQHPRPAGDTLKCLTCDLQVLQTPVLPATIAELCRQVLQLCKDAGCHTVDLKISPNWQSGFHGQVQV
jgi:predicted thioesterase